MKELGKPDLPPEIQDAIDRGDYVDAEPLGDSRRPATDDRQTIAAAEKDLATIGYLGGLIGPELCRIATEALDAQEQALKDATQNASDTKRSWDRAERLALVVRVAERFASQPGCQDIWDALAALHEGDL